MPKKDDGRKLTTEDVIHIGLATRDPGAYMFASLAVEIVKLPFVLIGAVIDAVRDGRADKKRKAEELVRAEETAKAREVALAKSKEEYSWRMKQRRQEFIRREEERQKQEILTSMMAKVTEPEIRLEYSEQAKDIFKGNSAPEYYVDSYLYALELIRTPEVRTIVSRRGLDAPMLEEKLRELHLANRQLAAGRGHRLTPRIKKAVVLAGRRAKARYNLENPGQSGCAVVTVEDLFEGAIDTEGFVEELGPVWEHLRKARGAE
jgi:hypothetical protein